MHNLSNKNRRQNYLQTTLNHRYNLLRAVSVRTFSATPRPFCHQHRSGIRLSNTNQSTWFRIFLRQDRQASLLATKTKQLSQVWPKAGLVLRREKCAQLTIIRSLWTSCIINKALKRKLRLFRWRYKQSRPKHILNVFRGNKQTQKWSWTTFLKLLISSYSKQITLRQDSVSSWTQGLK